MKLFSDYTKEIFNAVETAGSERIAATQTIVDKSERQNAEAELKEAIKSEIITDFEKWKALKNRFPQQSDQ